MRTLLLLPLPSARFSTGVATLGSELQGHGHEVHAFVRECTRVATAKGPILSRNAAGAAHVVKALGVGCVSTLHSHLSAKGGRADDLLAAADKRRLESFAGLFQPDLVIACADDIVPNDLAITDMNAWRGVQALLLLRRQSKSGQWSLHDRAGRALARPAGSIQTVLRGLASAVLPRIDRARSAEAMRKLLARGSDIAALHGGKRKDGSGAGTVTTALRGEALAAAGELESVRDGDVVFGDDLWLKGWIDFSSGALRELELRINDQVQRCRPTEVRGDVAERIGTSDALGFDARMPIRGEGPPLTVVLSLVFKDGRIEEWKRLRVWSNDCVPKQHAMPVLLGLAHHETSAGTGPGRIVGEIGIAEYRLQAISAMQRGSELGRAPCGAEASDGRWSFELALGSATAPGLPVELWVEVEGHAPLHWMRCELAPAANGVDTALTLTGVRPGQAVRVQDVPVAVEGAQPGETLHAWVNGRRVASAVAGPQSTSLGLNLADAGNDVHILVESEAGARAVAQIWRHVDDPLADGRRFPIVVPGSGARPMRADASGRLLLIRKAASPTDELYVIAPLERLMRSRKMQLCAIDLDDDQRQASDLDEFLHDGDVIVVSRYVNDAWIEALTRNKHRLGPVFYLMDDDVAVAIDTQWLPKKYRQRMIRVAAGEFATMLRLCDRFLVTSPHLASRYASAKTRLVVPPYLSPPADLVHLNNPKRILITYQGTEGHKDDLAAITPALCAMHDLHAHVDLLIIVGNLAFLPEALATRERCRALPPMRWDEYRAFRAESRAHIAVVPLLDTPYNRGKSIVKLHDVSALGAVGVYSNCPPYDGVIEHDVNGLLVENDPLMWQKALAWLIKRPDEMKRMALAAQETAKQVGNLRTLEAFWAAELGGGL